MKLPLMAFLFLCISTFSWGTEDASVAAQEDKIERDTLKQAMELMLEQSFSKNAKSTCEGKGIKDTNPGFGECVFSNLNQQEKEEAYKLIDEVDKQNQQQNAKPILYESRNIGKVEFYRNPVLNQISKKLSEQFKKAIYGELTENQKKKKLRVVDPQVFHRIYKSQISKNLILNMTEFCISTTFDKNKGVFTYDDTGTEKQNKVGKLKVKAADLDKGFKNCFVRIGDICTNDKSNGSGCPNPGVCPNDDKTQQLACSVQELMYSTKRNLLNTDNILAEWDEFEKTDKTKSMNQALNGQAVDEYNGTTNTGDDRKSIDELTSVTSGQFEKMVESGKSDLFAEHAEELKNKCAQNKNDPECAEVILKKEDAEKKAQEINEFELRTKIIAAKMEEDFKKDDKNLKAYLENEGVENVDEIMKDSAKVAKLKERIQETYKAKKEAIIQRMRDKLKEIDPNQGANSTARMAEVEKELKKKKEDFSQLIHFSNIMSSFFSVDKKGVQIQPTKSKGQGQATSKPSNTVSALREIESLGKSFEGAKDALKQQFNSGGGAGSTSGGGSDGSSGEVGFDVSTINQLILPEIEDKKGQKTP